VSEYRNVVEPFLANVEKFPDRLAVVYEGDRLTYDGLYDDVRRCAQVMYDRGVRPQDKVAFILPNRAEVIIVYLAIEYMGAVAVPMNFRLIPREIAYLANSVDAKMLLFDQRFEDRIQEARPELHDGIDMVAVGKEYGYAPRLWKMAEAVEEITVPLYTGGGLARIQFTGGTSGVPKGACRTHAADLVELHSVSASNGMLEMDHPTALIQCPLEHHGGHSWFMSSLAAGATVVVCGKFNPEKIYAQIDEHQVTHMILLPPTTYLRLVRDPSRSRFDLSSVRIVQSAAGQTTPEIIEGVFEAFPNADFNYGWGQTESGTGTSMRMTREMYRAHDPKLASVGKPMETLVLKIVDDDGQELSVGQPGEALAKGPTIMEGYYNQPELTAKAFTSDGWLRTGDIMYRDEDGYYYLTSRKKDMIKSGGENVFINEVQTAILRNPKVADCVVFGTKDPVMGEAVAAVVQPVPGATLTAEEVQDTCKQFIASYKKPRYIEFIDDIGRDDAGKVRLQTIKEYFDSKRAEHEAAGAAK
jgi:long-chain acyl-CoA synthetase